MSRLDHPEPEQNTAKPMLGNPFADEVQWEELCIAHLRQVLADRLRAERLGIPLPGQQARPCPVPLRRIV
jgi:hypothetical protein